MAVSWLTKPTVLYKCPSQQVSAWLCLVLFSFLSRAVLFPLLASGILYANKVSSLMLYVFTSFAASLASKALLIS